MHFCGSKLAYRLVSSDKSCKGTGSQSSGRLSACSCSLCLDCLLLLSTGAALTVGSFLFVDVCLLR